MRFALRHTGILILLAVAFTGCSLVDEDMRDCETDYTLDYELRLVTNMTTELQTQLGLVADINVSNAIKTQLSSVFTDHAHDVDLGFYDVVGDSTLLHRESHVMDASQSSYTLYIPVRRYMHIATANLEQNPLLSIEGADKCHTLRVAQQVRDTITSHKTGFFSARLPMDIKEGVDQQFDVKLYMANCASSVVIDTVGSGIKDVRVFMTGFATSFDLCDSLYHFDYTPVVKPEKLEFDDPTRVGFLAVTFPSRPAPSSKVVIDWDDPFVTETAAKSLWQVHVYCTLADGSVTQNILGVHNQLLPGQFRLLRARAYNNGSLAPDDPTVAVSVTLNWEPGLEIPVVL